MARATASLDWLPAAQEALNADPAFRKLGTADFRVGLVIGDEARLVTFRAFEVAELAHADRGDMRDADYVLEMSARDWNSYLRQRARAKGETLLALDLEKSLVKARNPLERLAFERYHRTLQAFIDKGAALSAAS